ncbi:hypothetical protein [Amycolatopsis taiwanensis]|nr:hypothetical protein [Amycolatopsis taiwanensis]
MTSPSEDHTKAPTPVDSRPPLPRRRRQANLAPQLAAEAGSPIEEPPVRSAELARETMTAFQRGTRRAREARPNSQE